MVSSSASGLAACACSCLFLLRAVVLADAFNEFDRLAVLREETSFRSTFSFLRLQLIRVLGMCSQWPAECSRKIAFASWFRRRSVNGETGRRQELKFIGLAQFQGSASWNRGGSNTAIFQVRGQEEDVSRL